jgi:hypothetical protein
MLGNQGAGMESEHAVALAFRDLRDAAETPSGIDDALWNMAFTDAAGSAVLVERGGGAGVFGQFLGVEVRELSGEPVL